MLIPIFLRAFKGEHPIYVPEELAPEVGRCLDNGRALQELLYEAAPRYIKALKRERDKGCKKAED
jgi:hypothetical protein